MKYVIMIHSNPEPWGHPTSNYLPAYQELSDDARATMDADFEKLLTDLSETGELIRGEALGDPKQSRLFRWEAGKALATDGPYAEAKEHLAGFFMIDVADQARAEQIATRFSGPGETIELREVF